MSNSNLSAERLDYLRARSRMSPDTPDAVVAATAPGIDKEDAEAGARARADRYASSYGGMLENEPEPAPTPKGPTTRAELQRVRDDAQRKCDEACASKRFEDAVLAEAEVKKWDAAIRLADKSEQDARTAAQSKEAVAARRAAAEADAKRVADAAVNKVKIEALVERVSDLMVELDAHGLTALLGESGFPGRASVPQASFIRNVPQVARDIANAYVKKRGATPAWLAGRWRVLLQWMI